MSCPHGQHSNPATCSQCLGIQVNRHPPRTPAPIEDMPNVDDTFGAKRRMSGVAASKGTQRHCGQCGKEGHNRQRCGLHPSGVN